MVNLIFTYLLKNNSESIVIQFQIWNNIQLERKIILISQDKDGCAKNRTAQKQYKTHPHSGAVVDLVLSKIHDT